MYRLKALALICAGMLLVGAGADDCRADVPNPKIRTITAFIRLDAVHYKQQVLDALQLLTAARTAFRSQAYDVQTIRIVTQPFPEYTKDMTAEQSLALFRDLDQISGANGVLINIGPAITHDGDDPRGVTLMAEVLAQTKLNSSVIVADDDGIHWNAINAAAHAMKYLADNTKASEGNFRFAASSFVPPLTPFFPAAYHSGLGHSFSIGLESANVVQSVFSSNHDRDLAKAALSKTLAAQAAAIESIAQTVAKQTGWEYSGIDMSPAPLAKVSIGAAIEDLTGQPVGAGGTLTVAALLTAVLKDLPVKHAGYSGLMLPILEDERLAQRWNEGWLSLDSLLSYSAVCGTGLDVVPLPGDTSEKQIVAIIGDVASLAFKWHKPLTARLLPVAGKRAGDRTEFTDPLLTNVVLQPLTPVGRRDASTR